MIPSSRRVHRDSARKNNCLEVDVLQLNPWCVLASLLQKFSERKIYRG
jgi:hypothetical protein